MWIIHTLRQLAKKPAFSLLTLFTLALGIGTNASIFAVVRAVLLKPLAYSEGERIVALNTRFRKEARAIPRLGGGDYMDVRQQASNLGSLAWYYATDYRVQVNGRGVYTKLVEASSEFPKVLGWRPLAGRLFSAGKAAGEVMLSSSFASAQFGDAHRAVGKLVELDGKAMRVAGVVGSEWAYPAGTEVFIGASEEPDNLGRDSYNQEAIGKLKSGVRLEALSSQLQGISARLAATYRSEDGDKAIEAVALQDQLIGSAKPLLRLLGVGAGLVLLVVCINLTHLQLVRALDRQREYALRLALGASRGEVLQAALPEAAILSLVGGALGFALTIPFIRLLLQVAPADLPRLQEVHPDLALCLVAFLLSALVMLLASALPALKTAQADPAEALKQDAARGMEGRQSRRLRSVLVVAEIACTLMLCTAAGLLGRTLMHLAQVEMGYTTGNILVMDAYAGGGEGHEEARMGATRRCWRAWVRFRACRVCRQCEAWWASRPPLTVRSQCRESRCLGRAGICQMRILCSHCRIISGR